MYSIFTYIWAIFWVNVGKYSIHGAYGNEHLVGSSSLQARFVQPPKKKSCSFARVNDSPVRRIRCFFQWSEWSFPDLPM